LVGVLAFQSLIALLKPEVSIDGQLYHGPILGELISSNSIWGWIPLNQYVYYTDLTSVGGINLATFTGSTYFDDALQIPFLALLFLSINYVLSPRLRSPFLRFSIAFLISSAPVIWLQPRILYVDLAYAVAIVIPVFVITRRKKLDNYDLLIAIISIAGVLATKPSGLAAGLFLFSILFFRYIFGSDQRLFSKRIMYFFCISIPVMVAGSLIYVRNLISFGNPIYPIKFSSSVINLPGIIDFNVFASGSRGTGVADLSRINDYFGSMFLGVFRGIQKFDYDPRDGGFGYIPLAVVAIVCLFQILQLSVSVFTGKKLRNPFTLTSVYMALIALVLTAIQPSSFDSRYVIAPTVILLCSIALINFEIETHKIHTIVASFAVFLAVLQIIWTEVNMYPGINSIRELKHLSSEWQPVTPGNLWGDSSKMSWLENAKNNCSSISVEYSGGLTENGMNEPSFLGVFSYGLYGKYLCNRVIPRIYAQNKPIENDQLQKRYSLIENDDFFILYTSHMAEWKSKLNNFDNCWETVQEIKGTDDYLEALTVLKNKC
jgi:hypothetical protein